MTFTKRVILWLNVLENPVVYAVQLYATYWQVPWVDDKVGHSALLRQDVQAQRQDPKKTSVEY